MTFNQKKFLSLFLACLIVGLLSTLTGCSSKTSDDAKKEDVTKQQAKPDNGVRKPGQSGFKAF